MFCMKCGKQIDDGAVFCPFCSAKQPKASWLDPVPSPVVPVGAKPETGLRYADEHAGTSVAEYTIAAPAQQSATQPRPVMPVQAAVSEGPTYFDGKGLEHFGKALLCGLITVFSLGFAWPWAQVMYLEWEQKHTIVNGRRLRFTGKGGDLFKKNIKWVLLSAVTCGIYGLLFVPVAFRKWIWEHTTSDSASV